MLFKKFKLDKRYYSEITEGQAKRLYRNGETVWVSNGEVSSPIDIRKLEGGRVGKGGRTRGVPDH